MHQQVQNRIDTLRKEMEMGEQRMRDLKRQVARLRDTMLRISGAIQVLEELQAGAAPPSATSGHGNGEDDRSDAASGARLLGA